MSGAQGGGIEALCLEEMLKRRVECGALFYGQRKRRTDVLFDEALRALTSDSAHRLHALITSRVTPLAVPEKKCKSCSLLTLCLPAALTPYLHALRSTSQTAG